MYPPYHNHKESRYHTIPILFVQLDGSLPLKLSRGDINSKASLAQAIIINFLRGLSRGMMENAWQLSTAKSQSSTGEHM